MVLFGSLRHNVVRSRNAATASGEPRGMHKAGDQIEFRFRMHKDDFDPYVVAGAKEGEAYKNLGRAWIVARNRAGLHDAHLARRIQASA